MLKAYSGGWRNNSMRISRLVELLVFVGLVITLPALAEGKKIKRTDLPAAVEKTVAAQSQGAKIQGFSEEKENGQTLYEVEMVVDGHSKDSRFGSNSMRYWRSKSQYLARV